MKRTSILATIALVYGLASFAKADMTLGHLMVVLADQKGGINTLSKLDPKATKPEDFEFAVVRPDIAAYILGLQKAGKGKITEKGEFEVGQYTPPIFKTLKETDLPKMMENYDAAIDAVALAFANAKTEIVKQKGLAPADRDFKVLKQLVVKIANAQTAAHSMFIPPPQ